MKTPSIQVFFVLIGLFSHIPSHSKHFMYQPGYPFGKKHHNEHHPLSATVWLQGGSTEHSRNTHGDKTELLNLYGNEQIAHLFSGVDLAPLQGLGLLTIANQILAHDLTTKSLLYGAHQINGKFSIFSAGLHLGRQISEHISIHTSLPFHHFKISEVTISDITPAHEKDEHEIAVTSYLTNFLQKYNLTAGNVKDTTLGDIQCAASFYFAWDNHPASEYIGNTSVCITTGITIPTARERNTKEAFYIPMGNNGHAGFPLSLQVKIDPHTNIRVKASLGFEAFLKHISTFRMKTDTRQNGFLKLQTGQAREKLGNKFDLNFKGCLHDYYVDGLSFTLGYRYEHQNKSTLKPYDTVRFNELVVNSDETLQSWSRHNISVGISYAPVFDEESHNRIYPCVGFLYTQPIKGKRIFNTYSLGGHGSIHFSWNF